MSRSDWYQDAKLWLSSYADKFQMQVTFNLTKNWRKMILKISYKNKKAIHTSNCELSTCLGTCILMEYFCSINFLQTKQFACSRWHELSLKVNRSLNVWIYTVWILPLTIGNVVAKDFNIYRSMWHFFNFFSWNLISYSILSFSMYHFFCHWGRIRNLTSQHVPVLVGTLLSNSSYLLVIYI